MLKTDDTRSVDEAMRLYRERFAATGIYENRVYAKVPQMLDNLRDAGCMLFLATSKPRIYAQRIVDHLELTKYLSGVYGSELDGAHENKSDLLRSLLNSEALEASASAMVGDRSHDMIAAAENCLCAVGVAWGYGSVEELAQAGASVICKDPDEVFHFLTGSTS